MHGKVWECRERDRERERGHLLHVLVHEPGDLGAALEAAEGGALPDTPRDKLKGPGGDLLAGGRHAHDHRSPPALASFIH